MEFMDLYHLLICLWGSPPLHPQSSDILEAAHMNLTIDTTKGDQHFVNAYMSIH